MKPKSSLPFSILGLPKAVLLPVSLSHQLKKKV